MTRYKDSLADLAVSPELIRKTGQLMRQKRDGAPKRAMTIRYASAAACAAAILLAAIAVPNWIRQTPPHASELSLAVASSSAEAFAAADVPADGAQSVPAAGQQKSAAQGDSVRVNQLGDMIEKQPQGSGPAISRMEQWTFRQYCVLLGFDPLPTAVPEGLHLVKNDTKQIAFQQDKRLDFYNTWGFVYTSGAANNAETVTVQVNPSSIPYWSVPRAYQLQGDVQVTDVDSLLKLGEKSRINGTEVTIWHKGKGSVWDYMGGDTIGKPLEVEDYYCADFSYKGAGFSVTAQNGVSQEEFVQVLKSILK